MTTTLTDTELLAALGFADRPDVSIDRPAPLCTEPTVFVVKQYPEDPDGGAVFVGVVVADSAGPYLGCLDCDAAITEDDAAMCFRCREDAAWRQSQR